MIGVPSLARARPRSTAVIASDAGSGSSVVTPGQHPDDGERAQLEDRGGCGSP